MGVPVDPVRARLEAVVDSHRTVLEQTLSERLIELGEVISAEGGLQHWETILVGRPEAALFSNGRREFARGVVDASTGNYGSAQAQVRLFLELTFAGVYFSANELRLRQWLADQFDFSWSQGLDGESGTLAAQFVTAFNTGAASDAPAFQARAAQLYRACSQYVHGKHTAQAVAPLEIEFDAGEFDRWKSTALHAVDCVSFLLFVRYGTDVLPTPSGDIEGELQHRLGHVPSVQQALNGATE